MILLLFALLNCKKPECCDLMLLIFSLKYFTFPLNEKQIRDICSQQFKEMVPQMLNEFMFPAQMSCLELSHIFQIVIFYIVLSYLLRAQRLTVMETISFNSGVTWRHCYWLSHRACLLWRVKPSRLNQLFTFPCTWCAWKDPALDPLALLLTRSWRENFRKCGWAIYWHCILTSI